MRKKNLLLLTSITGLLLTLTPVQALAQETSTSPTSTSQSSDDKEFENEKDKRLPTDEKCHWKGETPVPENKYLKLLYDSLYKDYEDDLEKIKNGDYYYRVKKPVEEGKMSENEAQYRTLLYLDRHYKSLLSSGLYFNGLAPTLDPENIKQEVNRIYDNPENADEITQEIIDSYSLKDYLEYVDKYVNPDVHISYSSKELHEQYQKEFNELDKTIEYNKDDNSVWYKSDNFKVVKKLDKYSSDEEQIQRLIQLRAWLNYFPTKEEIENNDDKNKGWGYASASMVNEFPDLLKLIKEKGLDNDEFYQKANEYFKTYDGDWGSGLSSFLKENGIEWNSYRSAKSYPMFTEHYIYPVLFSPDFEIPRDVVCDDEETPGEDTDAPTNPETPGKDTDAPTNPETPDNPETPEDKETTTPTTKTTSKQDKPSTKTSTKSSDKSLVNTTISNDKEDSTIKSTPITDTPNQVKTPDKVNTPNNPINHQQEGFIPVNNTTPGTFDGGVSSSVDGEEISDGSKVDTGSPTTSILNKIRTIF